MASKTKCFHAPYPADDADMPCAQCYAVEETSPRRLRQVARLARMRPNPLNAHEVNRLVDALDGAVDELLTGAA